MIYIPKKLLLLFTIIFILIGVNVYLYLKTPKLQPEPQAIPKPFTIKVTPSASSYKTIYGKGTNIIYTSKTPYALSGSGLIETVAQDGKTYIGYIVGLFQGFESIANSTDKYALISEYDTNKVYKVRTFWGTENTLLTKVLLEDLNQIGDDVVGRGYLKKIGTIVDQSSRFTHGKVIITMLMPAKNNGIDIGPLKDINANYQSEWIVMR